jgi:hypothetical protein
VARRPSWLRDDDSILLSTANLLNKDDQTRGLHIVPHTRIMHTLQIIKVKSKHLLRDKTDRCWWEAGQGSD